MELSDYQIRYHVGFSLAGTILIIPAVISLVSGFEDHSVKKRIVTFFHQYIHKKTDVLCEDQF
jgi:hypothetical protein